MRTIIYVSSGYVCRNANKNQYRLSPYLKVCQLIYFIFTVSFLTVLIITIERAVLPEPPRDPTGKFYIFRRSSGEIVFTSRVEEEPELLKEKFAMSV